MNFYKGNIPDSSSGEFHSVPSLVKGAITFNWRGGWEVGVKRVKGWGTGDTVKLYGEITS